MLWLWELKDVCIIGFLAILSLFIWSNTGASFLMIVTCVYAFLTISFDGISIMLFLKYAVRFFAKTQEFEWRKL